MTTQDLHFRAGAGARMRAFAKRAGLSPHALAVAKHTNDGLTAGGYGRVLALMADVVLTKAGSTGSFEQQLYNKLWQSRSWGPGEDALLAPVRKAAANVKFASLVKEALGGPLDAGKAIAGGLIGSGGKDGGGVVGTLAALTLLAGAGGAGLGALNWHLRQDTQEDDVDNEKLRAKSEMYRDMASQIQQDIRLRGWRP